MIPLKGRKIRSGANRAAMRKISIIVSMPVETETVLFPWRFLTWIGTYSTLNPSESRATVMVVENENPDGHTCIYLLTIDRFIKRSPEFKSGMRRRVITFAM